MERRAAKRTGRARPYAISVLGLVAGCSEPAQRAEPEDVEPARTATAPGAGGWLQGDVDERFALVAKHLRGFDLAMVEVGYRYTELYWAGRDRNWDYAAYQLGKIETAVANGVQRRPKRAQSARMLEGAVGQIRGIIEARDAEAFDRAFEVLTATCNACHQAENVPFMTVEPPTRRLSPIRARADTSAHEVQP